jgi:hypothetical protein
MNNAVNASRWSYAWRLIGTLLILVLSLLPIAAQVVGPYREVFLSITGGSVSNLTNAAVFPNQPGFDEVLTNNFLTPSSYGDNYGQRVRGLLVPPLTGNYYFAIASDDNSELWLSPDPNPSNRVRIANVRTNTGILEYTKETNQLSAAISLVAGQQYYLEALHKESTSGDGLSVTWRKPGDAAIANNANPIPASNFLAYGLLAPAITGQPTNVVAVEGTYASWTVRLARLATARYQWQANGVNLASPDTNVLTLGPLALTNNNLVIRCAITNAIGTIISTNAILTVLPDTNPPAVLLAVSSVNATRITVVFSEPVDTASATNLANYSLDNGAVILSATVGANNRIIVLTTTAPLARDATYQLTVNRVRDLAATPNLLSPQNLTFSTVIPALSPQYLSLPLENPGASSRRHGLVLSEVMYHPAERTDGRVLEFIEVFNSQPWFEDLSGWNIDGAVKFTFPTNTILPGWSHLVVAAQPEDVRAVTGLTNVFGPFDDLGRLPNNKGDLRLRNKLGAVHFEMYYENNAPYPVAADGAGHSLVLARPSYGERDARAWAASDLPGGSPGRVETASSNAYASVFLNEILAHTSQSDEDFVELFNYSTNPVNLAGCILTDDLATNKLILTNLVIAPLGYALFHTADLGFALAAGGETLYLFGPDRARVVDALRYGPQEFGVSFGRSPDGSPDWSRLNAATPTGPNTAPLISPVVINEIMYQPMGDATADEYVELHNWSDTAVDLSGWKLEDGVEFTVPENTWLAPGGYLVIAANAARMQSLHPQLNGTNCLGNWAASLRNRGERLALSRRETVISTNAVGTVTTNHQSVVVDDVTYGNGGRWGNWSAGRGSSLELRHPYSNHQRAANWGDSDETAKSGWIPLELTGVLDNGISTANQVEFYLFGPGECLIDNVEVLVGGVNLVPNPTFESGASGWFAQGNHDQSDWEAAEGYASQASLHLRATDAGGTSGNRVRAPLTATIASGTTATLRVKVRWLKGHPRLLMRLHGSWLEVSGYIYEPNSRLGTPGLRNTIATSRLAPAISDVRHYPATPASLAPVQVVARVDAPDGLSELYLEWRKDPETATQSLPMQYHGAGLYSATLPGQSNGITAAFAIVARDTRQPANQGVFPANYPTRECVVRWGDTRATNNIGSYRIWVTQKTYLRWITRDRMSNDPLDCTVVYGDTRVVYNAGCQYSGSPYHSVGYTTPTNSNCDFVLTLGSDDPLLGEEEINLFMTGNGGGDTTTLREIHAYWLGYQLGLSYNNHRLVQLWVNGVKRGTLVADAQQPTQDYVDQWYPGDTGGDLHKIANWFEFDGTADGTASLGFLASGASLNLYTTTGGQKKLARYRQNWPRRAFGDDSENYQNVFNLVDASQTTATGDVYTAVLNSTVDVDNWFRVHVVNHIIGNTDSFSYGGGQNMYAYKPTRDVWHLCLWDIDFAFGNASLTNGAMFNIGGKEHGPLNTHPPFARLYWQAIIEAVNGPLDPAKSFALIDDRYNGLVANGITPASFAGTKTYCVGRRDYMLGLIASNTFPFALTTDTITSGTNMVTLTGTAPLDVRTLLINGIAYTPNWTTLSNWTLPVPLPPGSNRVTLAGFNSLGTAVTGAVGQITVVITNDDPAARVVFNEIMHTPATPDTAYVELFNTSTRLTFDLSGWRINGLDYTFPDATWLPPRGFLVIPQNRAAFQAAYGSSIPLTTEYAGRLDSDGETLTLLRPGAGLGEWLVMDKMHYETQPPWPTVQTGRENALQRLDPAAPTDRLANWSDGSGWRFFSSSGTLTATQKRLMFYLDTKADIYLDDIVLVRGSAANVGTNLVIDGDFEGLLFTNQGGVWNYSNPAASQSHISTNFAHSGRSSLHLVFTNAGSTTSYLYEDTLVTNSGTHTLSFWYLPGTNANRLTSRMSSLLRPEISVRLNLATPGQTNSLYRVMPALPNVWLNEIAPGGSTSALDNAGEQEPWLEIHNEGTNAIDLGGLYLTDDYQTLDKWRFPTGTVIQAQQFLLVWLDGQTNQTTLSHIHAGFRPSTSARGLALAMNISGGMMVLDYLNWSGNWLNYSHGAYPDGQGFTRQAFDYPTPGGTNNPARREVALRINEWMADNSSSLIDPADGQPKDWFELHNPGSNAVDLAGFHLSDDTNNPTRFTIPPGYGLAPKGHLLVWADDQTALNNPALSPNLHLNFQLSRNGETIALYSPQGELLDLVNFGTQAANVSQGRFPDSSTNIQTLPIATPGAANTLTVPTTNQPPVIGQLTNLVLLVGQSAAFTIPATDANQPAQTLSYYLLANPAGASLNASNGWFQWTPTTAQTGTQAVQLRVIDSGSPPAFADAAFLVTVGLPPHLTAYRTNFANGQFLLNFNTLPGKTYQLQLREDVQTGGWTNVGPVQTSTSNSLIWLDSLDRPKRFYRLLGGD